jgi:hypothetical protein
MASEVLTPEELKKLQKEVRRAKRIATEWASKLHDLVEDRLPAGFEEIPEMARGCFDACQTWRAAANRLEAAEAAAEASATTGVGS